MLNLLKSAGHVGMIVQLTGEPGTGKTWMALATGAQYSETVLINADVKRALVEQILAQGNRFGLYRDAVAEIKDFKEVKTYEWFARQFDEIEKLPPENRRVIIIDRWEVFEITLKPYVETYPGQFRDFWSSMGTFKGPQQWQASHDLSGAIVSRLSNLCEILILTSHLRNAYRAGVAVPGKLRPDNKIAITQKADLRLWLRPNAIAIPLGLAMKRGLAKVESRNGKPKLVNVLPRKLTPFPEKEDADLWDVIKRYWMNPVGNRKPEAFEEPNDFEISILEGILTIDQEYAWKHALAKSQEEEMLLEGENRSRVAELKAEGKSYPEIAKAMGLSLPEVVNLLTGE